MSGSDFFNPKGADKAPPPAFNEGPLQSLQMVRASMLERHRGELAQVDAIIADLHAPCEHPGVHHWHGTLKQCLTCGGEVAPRSLVTVLRCPDIEATRVFYEGIGLTFVREKHGDGPEHYAARIGDAVLELYPTKAAPSVTIGFDDAEQKMVDPDGRRVLR